MMTKPQWITAGIALIIAIGLYAATEKQIFGPPKNHNTQPAQSAGASISTDSILFHAKEKLPADQLARIALLEHSITRGDVGGQQLHIYHQLAAFWRDTAHSFVASGWYSAEAARLENSEKSLTFAARLFLNGLSEETDPVVRQWEAFQAKDLFERSLRLNPANDSARIELGTVIFYSNPQAPMEGIMMIRGVAEKDPKNTYALMTLGKASLMSGQLDKALERFSKVAELEPSNMEATIRAAETAQQMGNKKEAITWYQKSLPYITIPEVKQEVEARIAELKK
ncbi:MAG: tetratricopeptide repeat protein [Flavisolibacter sp.]